MKIIIYGIGKMFNEYFVKDDYWPIIFAKNDIEIVDFMDGKIGLDAEINYRSKKFQIHSIQFPHLKDYDYIVITSSLYYEEIKKNLIMHGFSPNRIVLFDDFIQPYMEQLFHIELFQHRKGVEIGGPSTLFLSIYNKCQSCDGVNFDANTVWWKKDERTDCYMYRNRVLGNIKLADATDMNIIQDEQYEFLLSSNNLEHIANPIKALQEFKRVLKNGGILVIVVPKKDKTFDHNRSYTKFKHLLDDYNNNIGEDDLSHLKEIVMLHDYDMDLECGGRESFIKRAEQNLINRCLHQHVFNLQLLKECFRFIEMEVLESYEYMSNYVILGKKIN